MAACTSVSARFAPLLIAPEPAATSRAISPSSSLSLQVSSSVALGDSARLVLVSSIYKPLNKVSISSSTPKIIVINTSAATTSSETPINSPCYNSTSVLSCEFYQSVKRVQIELLGSEVPQTRFIDCQANN